MSSAPAYPSTRWVSDTQPKLFTNAGTASGATSSTCQSRRAGRSLRSTSQAAAVPITPVSRIAPRVSRVVLSSSTPMRGRTSRAQASSNPITTV